MTPSVLFTLQIVKWKLYSIEEYPNKYYMVCREMCTQIEEVQCNQVVHILQFSLFLQLVL
jgi:hypothetical protein